MPLKDEQLQEFSRQGHTILRGCIPRGAAQEYVAEAWSELGYDPNDPSTWAQSLFIGPLGRRRLIRDFAPGLWAAICQLVGGEARIQSPDMDFGWWVINFSRGKEDIWLSPAEQKEGWHTDGNHFRHFLDSPEQGLLVIPLFSDVVPRGGGTFLAADSVPLMARYLYDRPEGVLPKQFDYPNLIAHCHDFREFTGQTGDVALLHPQMLHNFSRNHSGQARFITNINIALKEPMQFHLADPKGYSPVEQAVLKGLGVTHLDFRPAAPRESDLPF